MFNFGQKIENNLAANSDPKDQLFLKVEELLDHFEQEFAEFKKTGESKEETRLLISGELSKLVDELVSNLLTEPTEDGAKKMAKMIAKICSQPYIGFGACGIHKIYDLFDVMDWTKWGLDSGQTDSGSEDIIDKTDRINLLVREIFSFYNLDPRVMISSWRASTFPDSDNEYEKEHGLKPEQQKKLVRDNLAALFGLEYDRPGSTSVLLKEYGLANFARYPEYLLCAQYDSRDDDSLPYGAVISSENDYNGTSYSNEDTWDNLFRNLTWDESGKIRSPRYLLRFMEAGGRFSVMRDLVALNQRYGNKQKISFAIFNGHGNDGCLNFGDNADERSSYIDKSDLPDAKWLGKVRNFFSDNATIVLDSCLTGQKDGLAGEVAKKLKIKVLACDRISGGIESIKVKEKKDHLDFEVNFMAERAPFLKKVMKDKMTARKAKKYV